MAGKLARPLMVGAMLLVALYFSGELTSSNRQLAQLPDKQQALPPDKPQATLKKSVSPVVDRKGPLRAEDIPIIVEAGTTDFEKTYKGKLFTAKMKINDVLERPWGYAIGLNNGERTTFPPITCNRISAKENAIGHEGDIMWVSGILDNLLGSTVFLDPCEISWTQEPSNVPLEWKLHPPRQ